MERWIEVMLNNSIVMSTIIVIMLVLSKLSFKKISAKWRYYTWLIVIVGLLIPFRPNFDIIPINIENPIQMTFQDKVPTITQHNDDKALSDEIENQTYTQTDPIREKNSLIRFSSVEFFFIIWILGFLIFIIYCGLKHKKFLNAVRRWSYDIDNDTIYNTLSDAMAEFCITKNIEIKTCKVISTPMLIKIIKPVILLPEDHFNQDELELIIKHELVHYKRKDLIYKTLVLFTNAIHWFNPFVYIMSRSISSDCEISCDESVLKYKTTDQRLVYGETIISIIRSQSSISTVLSTGFKGDKKVMEKRLFTIMDSAKKKSGIVLLCIVLTCTMFTGMAYPKNQINKNFDQSQQNELVYSDNSNESLAKNPNGKKSYVGNYSKNPQTSIGAQSKTGNWAASDTVYGNSKEQISNGKLKFIERIWNENKEDFIIEEGITEEEITDMSSIKYMYDNSSIYQNLITVDKTLFIKPQTNFSLIADSNDTLYKRYSFYLEKDSEITLSPYYSLNKGKISIYVVSPSGDVVYYKKPLTEFNTGIPISMQKGLFSIVLGYEMENGTCEGQISISGNLTGEYISKNNYNNSKNIPNNDYSQYGITVSNDIYYYNGQRIRIFMDTNPNNSFNMFFVDKSGTIDIKIVRDSNKRISKLEFLSESEANNILSETNNSNIQNTKTTSKSFDVTRLDNISDLPNSVQNIIKNQCLKDIFYNIKHGDRQYIFYNGLSGGYAYEPTNNCINIVDLKSLSKSPIILSTSAGTELSIKYNDKNISYNIIVGII